jgi:hypothetical protein
MKNADFTVIYRNAGISYKVCKVMFGRDGSFMVLSPYHPTPSAVLFKQTVNYALDEIEMPFSMMVDTGSLDDDEKRLKLTHHYSGYVQFSGTGIVSGRNPDGSIKGFGVQSWPLENPVVGPAFSVTLHGIKEFQQTEKVKKNACVFDAETLVSTGPNSNGIALEGFYFGPEARNELHDSPFGKVYLLRHPSEDKGAILRALVAPNESTFPGVIGLHMYHTEIDMPDDVTSSFMLGSSSGNMRLNERGEMLGDALFCMYPAFPEIPVYKSLNYDVGNDIDAPPQS